MVVLRIRRVFVEPDKRPEPLDMPSVDAASSTFTADIAANVESGAATLVLSGFRGVEDVQRCDIVLSVAEARAGRNEGMVSIVACVDSAAALVSLADLTGKSGRLAGLCWNGANVSSDLGHAADSDVAAHAWMQFVIHAKALALPSYEVVA